MSQRQSRSTYYVEGSTVRKLEAEPYEQVRPVRRPQRTPERRQVTSPSRRNVQEEKVNKKAVARLDKALAFDFRYTCFVVASVLIMVGACVVMLFWQSKIYSQQNNISNLEAELETIQADNAAYKMSIDNMYSLEQVYDAAVNELGMVYARKGQIVYYESADEDYVKQYQDVPAAN